MAETYRHTGSARARGYSQDWDKASALFRRAYPLCLGCRAIGKHTPTTVTDHVVPHKGNQQLFWDQRLWQPACRHHHDVIKQKLERLFEDGQAVQADLWLNSAMAISLSRRFPPRVQTGLDGWPVN